jgi:hypothetical protein
MPMQVDEGIAIYQVGCFILLRTHLPTKPCNLMTIENNVAMTQLRVLQLIFTLESFLKNIKP